jgi:hypothetical protein
VIGHSCPPASAPVVTQFVTQPGLDERVNPP